MILWRDIIGYEGLYQISNTGNVKSLGREEVDSIGRRFVRHPRPLLLSVNSVGYYVFGATKNRIQKVLTVHRCVAEAFICNPENKPEVNHKDGNKLNNLVDNLEWVTKSENGKHRFQFVSMNIPKLNRGPSKEVYQINRDTKEIINTFPSIAEGARVLGLGPKAHRTISTSMARGNSSFGFLWKFKERKK